MKNLILSILFLLPIFANAQIAPLPQRHTYVNGQDLELWHDHSIWVSGLDSFYLTTIGTGGPATWNGDTLNIPIYGDVSTVMLNDTAHAIRMSALATYTTYGDTSTFMITVAALNNRGYITSSALVGYATTIALADTAAAIRLNELLSFLTYSDTSTFLVTNATLNSRLTSYATTVAVGDTAAAIRANALLNFLVYGDTSIFLVTDAALNAKGYITGVTNTWGTLITSNYHIAVDSTLLETKLYALKQVDSIAALIPPTPTPYSLTTTGSSGAATLTGHTFNIPNYTLAGLGGIGLTALSATSPLSYNNATGVFGITQASTSTNGYLSSTDWNTFNNKGGGTVTSIATSTGITGGTITSTGTLQIDSTVVPKWDDTLSTNRWLVTPKYLSSLGYGTGTVTSITAGTGLSGGTITGSGTISMPNVGTAATYGSATQVPVFTTDAEGRVTSVTNTTISAGGTGTVTTVNTTPGQLTGGPITTTGTLGLATAGTAGTYGSATQVPVFTTDAYGRVTSVTNTTITGPTYSGGTGINITGATISAQNTTALWNANELQGNSISAASPSSGEVLSWNGLAWTPTVVSGGGTVTSIATSAPLTGGTITASGTIGITQATTSTNGYLSSTDWNTFNNKGSGTVTSINVVSNVAAYSVTPTSAVTSTGVYSFMATGAITQLVRGDGSLFNIGSNGYVLGVVSGALSWVLAPSSGGVTVGGTQGAIQFDNAGSLGGAAYCFIATDGNFIFSSQNTVPATPSSGYLKIYSNNGNGIDELHAIPSLGNEYILQASLSQHRVSKLYPQDGSASLLPEGTDFMYSGGSIYASIGSASIVNSTYDATNALPNVFTVKAASLANANASAGWYYASATSTNPVLIQNTAYSGATRLTIEFGLSVYASTQRIFIGYNTNSNAAPTASADPSASLNVIGLSKDVADGTFQFLTNGASGTGAKINTGITPNQNNWYRLTIFLTPAAGASISTGVYEELDVMTKSASPTVVYSGAITTKIPAAGTLMEPVIWVNTGTAAATVGINFMQMVQERFW